MLCPLSPLTCVGRDGQAEHLLRSELVHLAGEGHRIPVQVFSGQAVSQ